jgi:methionine-rich copper-binding protein CopC
MKKLLQIVALSVLAANLAYAHSELSESVPADKAVLEAAPTEVVLHFIEAVRLTALSLTKRGDTASDLRPLPGGASQHFAVAAPGMTAGDYTVDWRALSDDGHVLRGAFTFTVGAAPAHGEHSPHSEAGNHLQHSEHSEHPQAHR